MKIVIVGAGFTGLAAGLKLLEQGHEVLILEADNKAGGLAVGYTQKNWTWSLERFYHHIFTNDNSIIDLATKVGCPPVYRVPLSSVYRQGRISQLDSPLSLLKNRELSLFGRLRLAAGLAFLKLLPTVLARKLEAFTICGVLPLLVGEEGYQKVWFPLMKAKFGPFIDEVNLSWFWTRIAKRTTALGYFNGGFQALADALVDKIKLLGGEIRFDYKAKKIASTKDGIIVDKFRADKVLLTVPAPLVNQLIGPLVKWPKINYLWSQNVILELKQKFMKPYWLNILETDWPFLVLVEHTNFVSQKNYGGNPLLYIGNYLSEGDRRLKLGDKKLLDLYWPYLQKVSPQLTRKQLIKMTRFQAPFAQPVFPINYSKQIPPISTSDPNIFVANMSLVYPWDRGTNYAVELGQKAAELMVRTIV